MIEAIRKLLQPLKRQVDGMVRRAVLTAVDDGPGRQTVQLQDGVGPNGPDLVDGVEHWQPFGMRGYPPTGVDAIAFAVGGYRNHMVAFGASQRIKPTPELAEGDVCYFGVDPDTYTLVEANGQWTGQGAVGWFATLKDLQDKQYVKMTPGETILFVSDGGQFSRITITPGQVKIETPSFVHP